MEEQFEREEKKSASRRHRRHHRQHHHHHHQKKPLVALHKLEEISSGAYNTVYKTIYDGEDVIVRMSRVKDNADQNKANMELKERFDREIAARWPQQFMRLRKVAFFSDPNREFQHNRSRPSATYNERAKSSLVRQEIYSPVLDGTTLVSVWTKQAKKMKAGSVDKVTRQVCSILAQFCFAQAILARGGWMHADTQAKNLMFRRTPSDSSIVCRLDASPRQWTIPTYGKQWYLIDYDRVTLRDDPKAGSKIKVMMTNPNLQLAQTLGEARFIVQESKHDRAFQLGSLDGADKEPRTFKVLTKHCRMTGERGKPGLFTAGDWAFACSCILKSDFENLIDLFCERAGGQSSIKEEAGSHI